MTESKQYPQPRRSARRLTHWIPWLVLLLPLPGAASGNTLAVRAECLNGVPHGIYRVESAAGRVRIEGRYVDGLRDGAFVFYGAGGDRLISLPYVSGLLNGTVRAWHAGSGSDDPDAGLKLVSDIRAGFIDGRHQTWYENGERRSDFRLEDGEIAAGETWNPDGSTLQINSKTEFLNNEIESDFIYYDRLEQVMDIYPPAC